MHSNLQSRGFRIIPDTPQSGIIGVVIGDETKMRALSKAIYERNVYVNPVIYPAVARDSCRYRISLSALHERTDLDYALDVMQSVCRENGLI
jgi:glycine C-acetyltransferase